MSKDTAIGITGVKQTVKALQAFRPDLLKRMNKEIRSALRDTLTVTKSKYPNGAWRIQLNSKRVLGSIMAAPGKRIDNNWGASDPGVKASIFEFAGSRTMGSTPQSQGLIKSLNARYGAPGRFLWDAWDATGKGVTDKIRASVQRAERDLQATLDGIGESY